MKMQFIKAFVLALFIFCLAPVTNLKAQNRAYTATDRQVQYLLNRIETRTDTFKREVSRALNAGRLNNTDKENTANNYISDFQSATDALKQKFVARDSADADVEDLLNRAAYINRFLQNNRLSTAAQTNWSYVRTDLNTLARYYNINWSWTNPISDGMENSTGTAQTLPYNVSENTLRTLLVRIQTRTENFRNSATRALNRGTINNTNNGDISSYISDFENATSRLQQNFDARRSVTNDVQDVLNRAGVIEGFINNNRLNPAAQRDWGYLRTDLSTLASYYNVSWNWNNPATVVGNTNATIGGSYGGANERNIQAVLSRLQTRTDAYKREINSAFGSSVLNNTRSQESVYSYITDFENATARLRQNFDSRRATPADVEEVLNRAYYIDSVMRDYRFTPSAENQWKLIRTDLDQLSNYYNVSWNWNRQYVPQSRFDSMLTGTYRLNVNQSDNVSDVVGRAATAYYPGAQGDRSRTNLERRLTSPDMLVIEKRDKQVTVASSLSPQVVFNADGVARTETTANGRTIKITANTTYDGVALSYEGDRVNDFYVNFIPMQNGQLKVVRRVYLENRNETVTVASVYDKTDPTAQFSNINNQNYGQNTNNNNDFGVPNNTRLTAVLRTPVSTKASQNNDRFTMEVTSPSEFNGAIIEGRVTNAQRSGQVTGRANLSLEFDTIRLANGNTYKFAGIVDQVRLANGETVTVNNEGTVRDNNQTTKTVTRAGIGAAIGALIGAIAGGGQGAAIGAAVGAGAGAGTVILQGRGDVDLPQGTEVSITSSAPNNLNR
ncbi:MAG: hypothetical protein M3033_10615 [Acidobacteriota bacterium]|nr:hypothetical protein [Acidobacteriota bacterium]